MTKTQLSRQRSGPPLRLGAQTDPGARGKKNDDSYDCFQIQGATQPAAQVAVVADGVTSAAAGEQASDIAIQTIREVLQQTSSQRLQDRMERAVVRANEQILKVAAENPEWKGMSTTVVLAVLDGDQLYIAHLGDSRAYLIRREDDTIHQLTLDHTWVQEAMLEGRLTYQEATTHPNRHVIRRFLGAQRRMEVDLDIVVPHAVSSNDSGLSQQKAKQIAVMPGDAILLCSDGLIGKIQDLELCRTVVAHRGDPQKAIERLIKAAVDRGEPDNITGVIMELPESNPATAGLLSPNLRRLVAFVAIPIALLIILYFTGLIEFGPPGGVTADGDTSSQEVAVMATLPLPTDTPSPEAVTPEQVAADIAPTLVPTMTDTPTALDTPVPTATDAVVAIPDYTFTPTATREATQSNSNANPSTSTPRGLIATSTPIVTDTSTPLPNTSTPAPTATTSTRVPTVTSRSVSPSVSANQGNLSVELLGPLDEILKGRQTFSWSDIGLGPGQAYEMVFWPLGGEPFKDGRSPRNPLRETSFEINLDSFSNNPDLPLENGRTLRWGVLLVQIEPSYQRLQSLSQGHKFVFERTGSSDDSVGSNSGGGDLDPNAGSK